MIIKHTNSSKEKSIGKALYTSYQT